MISEDSHHRIDSVIGLTNGAAAAYDNLAANVRFNPAGFIDARNAGGYAAITSVPYLGGLACTVVLPLRMPLPGLLPRATITLET